MTKKQSAVKSSGKGKNIEISASSAPVIDSSKSTMKRAILAERGFITENPSEGFTSTVIALGWNQFVKHRKEYIGSLVRDFYKGIPETSDGKPATYSMVRGEMVKFDARTINDYYGLGYFGKAIENKQKGFAQAEMDAVKARICSEDAVWEKSGEVGAEFKLLKKYLCDEANMWFGFIRHSLLPTSHTLYVDKERLLVIDAIMAGDKIEVGKLINREINKHGGRKDGYLYFPCLITDLCIAAEVEIEAEELREKPSGAFPTKYKPRQKSGNATASGDSQTLQRLVNQQNTLAKFVQEQFEWQKKMFAYITKGKANVETPEYPAWLVEEEVNDDETLAAGQLKSVKKEKAKRVRSPLKKKEEPAKKKQKVSSEEEVLRSEDLEEISEPDEEESKKVAEEVFDTEEDSEETESEQKGSSSNATEIQCDPEPEETTKPPTKQTPTTSQPKQDIPTNEPIIPETPQSQPPPVIIPPPPPKEQTSTNPPAMDSPQPVNPTPEEQPIEQEMPAADATASSVAASEAEKMVEAEKPLVKQPRIKSAAKRNPSINKADVAAVGKEEEAKLVEEEAIMKKPEEAAKRKKLPVRRPVGIPKGKPATATSAVFKAAEEAEKIDVTAGVSLDATASKEPEVAKAHEDPANDQSKKEAEKEVAVQLSEMRTKKKQDANVAESAGAEASSDAIASDDTVQPEEKKKGKKKRAQASQGAPRASSRLRSGASKS